MNGFATPTVHSMRPTLEKPGFDHSVCTSQRHFTNQSKGAAFCLDPEDLASVRLAARLGCARDDAARAIDINDSAYRLPAPSALTNSQLTDGIVLEIAHYAVPQFKPEGWALD